MNKILFCLFFGLINTVFAWGLKTGTYDLYGTNGNGYNEYRGEVIISPQGDNYSVIWMIGNTQAQVGVGIYDDWENILSVAYTDLNRAQWGVVSYKINSFGELIGKWTSIEGTMQGTEILKWRSYSTY